MLKKLYYWFYRKTSDPAERDEYSGGYWQGKIRYQVIQWMRHETGSVLEIGCAEGLLLSQLAQACPRAALIGIDIDEARVAKAGKRLVRLGREKVSVVCADAAKTGFPDGRFDAVICVNFLLMLPSLEAIKDVLREAMRVLRPQGRIIFEFRSSRNLLFVLKYRFAHWYDATVKDQLLHTYTPEAMAEVMQSLGLSVRRKQYIGFGFHWFAPIIMLEVEKNDL